MIASLYKKHVTRVVLLGLLLAMAGIIWYGILPLKQVVYEKMRGIQEVYARRENREKQVARLPELKAQYDAILQNDKLLDILITEDTVVDFVKMLEGLASGSHIEISITAKENGKIIEREKAAVKPDQSESGDPDELSENSGSKEKVADILNDMPFNRYLYLSIKARGQYEDIIGFLRKMETLPVGLDVIRIEMKQGEAQKEAPIDAGYGVNPFFLSGGNTQARGAELLAAQKDVFEAVFDVVAYVDKQN